MPVEIYPSAAKIKRNGVYQNLPAFVNENNDNAAQQMIATAESSNVAQYKHEVGDYFRLNNVLYKTTSTINIGDSIVVGTNCEVAVLANNVSLIEKDNTEIKDSIIELNGTMIDPPTPTHGYYRGIVGAVISFTEQASSTAYQIDCTNYIGYDILVKFNTTATGSTRETCLCNQNDVISKRYMEKDMNDDGFIFSVTAENYKLYISYSEFASDLEILLLNGSIPNLQTRVKTLEALNNACYVDGTNGNDNNTGTIDLPYATINKAITSDRKHIYVKPGTYSERINLYSLSGITIEPYGLPDFAETSYEQYIILDGIGTRSFGVYCTNCNDITLIGIEAKNFVTAGFRLIGCSGVKFLNCKAHTSSGTYDYAIGFELINTDGIFDNCLAHDVSLDGFNFHGYGETKLTNCKAYNCGDDGASHHNACIGVIIGGEFYNNGKGGISSPTYGAYINIYNAYCHDNLYGIYTVKSNESRACKAILSGCLVKNNTNKDLYLRGATIIGFNNIYDTKEIGNDATFTEYPST